MLDPLTVDTQFATLTHSLSLLSSRRMRLLRVAEFAEPLLTPSTYRYLAAYVHELAPIITAAITRADFSGTPVAFAQRLLDLMDGVSRHFPDIGAMADWRHAHEELNTHLARSRGWLHNKGVTSLPKWSGRSDTVWVPFVERERLLKNSPSLFGTPLRMRVHVTPRVGGHGEDEIRVGEFESADAARFFPSLRAAKQLALLVAPHAKISPVRVTCTIDTPGLLEGESLFGGFAAATVCGVLQAIEHREDYAIRDDVAITGRIDEKGDFLPVEECGLRAKVEACIYSPVRILVVPKEQEAPCNALLTSMLAREATAPHRSDGPLRIIGASTLGDVFNNRLLIASHSIPAPVRIARRVWKQRRPIAAVLFVSMALAIGRLLYGPIDKIPLSGHFTGGELVLQNRDGQSLATLRVGERAASLGAQRGAESAGIFAIVPVHNAGEMDYRCVFAAAESTASPFEIRCWSRNRHEILWRYPLTVALKFPVHPTPEEKAFSIRQLIAGDFANDGSTDVIVLATGSGFATIVVELDLLTGTSRGIYAHAGHLTSMEAIDFDNDGKSEICLCGMNNAFGNEACLVVLDPREIAGHGPIRNEYAIAGFPPAHHRAYVLIPPSIVGGVFHRLPGTTRAKSLHVTQDGARQLQVNVVDVDLFEKDCFATTTANYYLTFNSRLEPSSMLTANDYDKLAENLFDDGKIAFLPKKNRGYQDVFFRSLLYWNGKGWEPWGGTATN
jgi:hypothetical protein